MKCKQLTFQVCPLTHLQIKSIHIAILTSRCLYIKII
jgi:hypothetical protein